MELGIGHTTVFSRAAGCLKVLTNEETGGLNLVSFD